MSAKGLDVLGWAIAELHGLIGHDKAAIALGQQPGDKTLCVICTFEREPTAKNRAAVYDALEGQLEPHLVKAPSARAIVTVELPPDGPL